MDIMPFHRCRWLVSIVLGAAFAAWTSGLAEAAAPARGKLAGEPAVSKTDGGHEISFALTAPNDVTVRILDANGEGVRHLACGMVGLEKAAPPFVGGLLAQKVLWDGRDDGGKLIDPTGCKVSIGIGARATFDKFILGNPDGFGCFGSANWATPGALAVGPRGELYFCEQYGVHFGEMRVFSREGKYVRQVWPFSANHPREDLESLFATKCTVWPNDIATWGASDYEDRTVPRSVRHSAFYWYAARTAAMTVGLDGTVFFTPGTAVDFGVGFHRIGPNGLPMATLGWEKRYPWIYKHSYMKPWNMAVGPDGDLYVSDKLYGVVAHLDRTGEKVVDSFQYQGTEKLAAPTHLIGKPDIRTGGQWDPLWGLAVDKNGNIWVANPKKKSLETYRKDGMLLNSWQAIPTAGGDVALDGGVSLTANLRSGAVYANIGKERGPRRLVKFASVGNPKPAAEMALPATARTIAADGDADLVWVLDSTDKLVRVKDAGDKFEAQILDGQANKTLSFPRLLTVDRQGRLYISDNMSPHVQSDIDGNAFRRIKDWGWGHSIGHGYSACDAAGNWYFGIVANKAQQVWKMSPEGKRLNFGAKDAITLENVKEFKGICIAASGDIYIAVTMPADEKLVNEVVGKTDATGEKYNFSRVDVFAPDGTLKKKDLVRLQGVNDIKLDRDGNVYVIEAGTCHGAHKRRAAILDNKKFAQFTKLMKFSPTGGVRDGEGHQWTYAGLSGDSSYTCAGECHATQLALDDDNRLWVLDTNVYNAAAVDRAGNLMFRVGGYGNADCQGGGGDELLPGTNMLRNPEIPLAHPSGVVLYRDYLIISDMFSHRVLRARLEHAENRELPLVR